MNQRKFTIQLTIISSETVEKIIDEFNMKGYYYLNHILSLSSLYKLLEAGEFDFEEAV